ncbi:MAG: radical SAM protein [Methylococcales bacterium]
MKDFLGCSESTTKIIKSDVLTQEEIEVWQPYRTIPHPSKRKEVLIQRLKDADHWHHHQLAGKRWAIGCVSLEITQRCNLDCTLCYLSDHSEAVHDLPLEEIFRRIDMIYAHYGTDTDIQISGGDPTLRKREELVAIVRRISELNMRSSLFTNGIKATRDLLVELAQNGLSDVAFHVDMTQERKGYASETALNAIREEYIRRCEGLPLSVFFNTTVFAGNFKEIPVVVEFFKRNAGRVKLASFQLQADIGRGVLRERDFIISQETVWAQIEKGAGVRIPFDSPVIGHSKCNKYGYLFEANGRLFNAWTEDDFVIDLINRSGDVQFSRKSNLQAIWAAVYLLACNPDLWIRGLRWLGHLAWQMKWDILKARGKVNKISFVTHNFMDACKLERDRIHACVFMVATGEGPISMCLHNAKRDQYILEPQRIFTAEGDRIWNPLTGKLIANQAAVGDEPTHSSRNPADLPRKKLKGRVRVIMRKKG